METLEKFSDTELISIVRQLDKPTWEEDSIIRKLCAEFWNQSAFSPVQVIGLGTLIANELAHRLEQKVKLPIEFADFLLADYEMDSYLTGKLCWRMGGTEQKYSTEDLFNNFVENEKNRKR